MYKTQPLTPHALYSHLERPLGLLVGHVAEDLVPLEHVAHALRVPAQPGLVEAPRDGHAEAVVHDVPGSRELEDRDLFPGDQDQLTG